MDSTYVCRMTMDATVVRTAMSATAPGAPHHPTMPGTLARPVRRTAPVCPPPPPAEDVPP
ncbi:hypothetical protein ACFY8S_36740 [Streptomyces hygroscopicus]|uniref:hypothetical protein n=1 Tax=Streptomyces hygroscopicus TaxID=1912 RepID=UPI0036D0AA2D